MERIVIHESEAKKYENSGPTGGHWGKPMVSKEYFSQITNGTEAGISEYEDTEFPQQRSHEDDEILFFYSGEGVVKIEETEVKVSEGCMIFIGAGKPHCVKKTSKENLRAAYFHNGQTKVHINSQ